jgi:serine/threonine-protein kinase
MTLNRDLDNRLPPVGEESATDDISVTPSEFIKKTRIGTGGMATVYEATVEGKPIDRVAVKEPDWDTTVDQSAVQAFVSEAETWARVDEHPYIGTVYGSGVRRRPWLAMEFLSGGTLADRMPVADPREALWIGSAVADGIQHAHHNGVAHLDLKPSNVLLKPTEDGKWDRPKIVDWGLATALDTDDEPDSLTPDYAAPEQLPADDSHPVGPMTDVYQLGALVYALLTGGPPEWDYSPRSTTGATRAVTPPSELRDSLPSGVDAVVLNALAAIPTDRVRTAAQFGEACEACFRELRAPDQGPESQFSGQPKNTESEQNEDTIESASVETNPPRTVFVDSQRDADGSGTDDSESVENNTTGDRTGWFQPGVYPEAENRSLAEALRIELQPPADESSESVASALRKVSMRFGRDTLSHRLSTVHSSEREN